MHNFITHYEGFLTGAAALWIFSAFVGGMPEPEASSSKSYRWFYGSLHLLAANLDKVAGSIKPPLK